MSTKRQYSDNDQALVPERDDFDQSNEYDLPRTMRMTQRDFKLFLVALDADEEPTEKLKALFRE